MCLGSFSQEGMFSETQFWRLTTKHKGRKPPATLAVAHTLLLLCYQVLKTGQPYQERGSPPMDEKQRTDSSVIMSGGSASSESACLRWALRRVKLPDPPGNGGNRSQRRKPRRRPRNHLLRTGCCVQSAYCFRKNPFPGHQTGHAAFKELTRASHTAVASLGDIHACCRADRRVNGSRGLFFGHLCPLWLTPALSTM